MNILKRLKQLEELAARRHIGQVVITLSGGTTRRLKAADVIPLLCSRDSESITDISGNGGAKSGLLIELLAGLVDNK